MKKDRICPDCKTSFSPTDPDRELCIECDLAAKDAQRKKHGPEKFKGGNPKMILNQEMRGQTRNVSKAYDDRLSDGFKMLGGVSE